MENKKLSLAQKFEHTFEYHDEVHDRIKEVTMLIRSTLSNNSDFEKKYPSSKCLAGFTEFDGFKKGLVFRVMIQKNIKEGYCRCENLGRLNLNVDNIENDEKLIKDINTWFANFLKEKSTKKENTKAENDG